MDVSTHIYDHGGQYPLQSITHQLLSSNAHSCSEFSNICTYTRAKILGLCLVLMHSKMYCSSIFALILNSSIFNILVNIYWFLTTGINFWFLLGTCTQMRIPKKKRKAKQKSKTNSKETPKHKLNRNYCLW